MAASREVFTRFSTEAKILGRKSNCLSVMIPKVNSAVEALNRGVGQVHICAWQGEHTLLSELTPGQLSGTTITL